MDTTLKLPADLPADVKILDADGLYLEEVDWNRNISPEQKLLGGPRQFDMVCSIMRDGIRFQYPEADEERVQEILLERLEIARRLEEWP